MKLSKISRSLVVVIFTALLVFLWIANTKLIFQDSDSMYPTVVKVIYVALLITLTLLYVIIKSKLYKRKIKRKVAFIYRYMYLSFVILFSRYIVLIYTMPDMKFSVVEIIVSLVTTLFSALIVKRIIFNISKSDMLSVLGTLAYSCNLTSKFDNRDLFFVSNVLVLFVLFAILCMQYLIDELKQKGIKTKKYHKYSLIVGISFGIVCALGINYFGILIAVILMLFITVNMDKAHISFPKSFIRSVSKTKRDKLYKLERLSINKMLISIFLIIITMSITYKVVEFILTFVPLNYMNGMYISNGISINNFGDFVCKLNEYVNSFVVLSSRYYFILITYILTLEALSFLLRRRYDTKTTFIKIIFIMVFMIMINGNMNVVHFQPMLSALLIIISIINTSSLYLNREERIKMLVA